MKYALLIYDNAEAWEGLSSEELESISSEYAAVGALDGVYGGAQLQPAETATTVRVADGEMHRTEGPFVEANEFLGGYYLLEADDLDAAVAVATRIPAARMRGAIEVRSIVER